MERLQTGTLVQKGRGGGEGGGGSRQCARVTWRNLRYPWRAGVRRLLRYNDGCHCLHHLLLRRKRGAPRLRTTDSDTLSARFPQCSRAWPGRSTPLRQSDVDCCNTVTAILIILRNHLKLDNVLKPRRPTRRLLSLRSHGKLHSLCVQRTVDTDKLTASVLFRAPHTHTHTRVMAHTASLPWRAC